MKKSLRTANNLPVLALVAMLGTLLGDIGSSSPELTGERVSTMVSLSNVSVPIAASESNPIFLPTPFPVEPTECKRPNDDYSIIRINKRKLNQRTFDMLTYAASLYGGSIDITGNDITQGSYNDRVPESYFTHWGGGVVDISVYDKSGERWRIKEEEIAPLIDALRVAGFAAWYRPSDYEGNDSPAHIHAISIGDEELSNEALNQVTGSCGYFRGFEGIPVLEQECRYTLNPGRDEYGGPVVCEWMCELGYDVLRYDIRCNPRMSETIIND